MAYNLIDMGFIKKTKEYENMKKEMSESGEKSVSYQRLHKDRLANSRISWDLNLKSYEIETTFIRGQVIHC